MDVLLILVGMHADAHTHTTIQGQMCLIVKRLLVLQTSSCSFIVSPPSPPLVQVRWADLEEQKEEQRRRLQMGFVLGSSWACVPEEQVSAILHGQRRTSSSSAD